MMCYDTKISSIKLGKLHLAHQSLRTHSFFFNEQRFKLVSAEERQNQHKHKCELKD